MENNKILGENGCDVVICYCKRCRIFYDNCTYLIKQSSILVFRIFKCLFIKLCLIWHCLSLKICKYPAGIRQKSASLLRIFLFDRGVMVKGISLCQGICWEFRMGVSWSLQMHPGSITRSDTVLISSYASSQLFSRSRYQALFSVHQYGSVLRDSRSFLMRYIYPGLPA